MSTILIGVDESERSEDAVAFARRLADVAAAHVIVANAYPYSDIPSRGANSAYRDALRDDALATVRRMRDLLDRVADDDTQIAVRAEISPAKALHQLAHAEQAALVVVGSSHTGRAGRVVPGSTAERLLHGSPCSVAVVPKDYRNHPDDPIRRIGVAYVDTDEGRAALSAATALARALRAELVVIGILSTESIVMPPYIGSPGPASLRVDLERYVEEQVHQAVDTVPDDVAATGFRATGDTADLLVARSNELDLLVMGSRGYGPLHAVLAGGVSGRVLRDAHCPVIVVPRGIEAPLDVLFGDTTATAA
ncbi:universal stress protein [Solirubrobacter soli]|uniref:universal stress protein n=1 Tax=Solirubrobacter soli TaxID=363832 RepID=UPI000400CBF8|nr:universal stress protein [Solirubrobacter soli]